MRTAEAAHARIRAAEAAAERERQWEAAMEQARADYVEAFRAKHLSTQVSQWREARAIRDYSDALETSIDPNSPTADDEHAWVAWARARADAIDPVRRVQLPPVPDEIDPADLKPFLRGWSPYGPRGWQ